MSNTLFDNPYSAVAIPSDGVQSLLVFSLDNDRVALPAIVKAQGSIGANTQFMQDMEGAIYYMVFGQKMSPMRFICYELENNCNLKDMSSTPDFLNALKDKIAKSELPEVTLVYGNVTIRGYLHEVNFESERGKGIYIIGILGKAM
ncbi:MAG: hypothetical protein EOM68_13780 [Spirochaetia bacterium]|jgi:hypothetical protein|nr:hypothetical protein [Spirochaetia bacterium]